MYKGIFFTVDLVTESPFNFLYLLFIGFQVLLFSSQISVASLIFFPTVLIRRKTATFLSLLSH